MYLEECILHNNNSFVRLIDSDMLYSCQHKWVGKCVYFSSFWGWEEWDTLVQITKTKSCSPVTTRKQLILKLNWMFLSSFLSQEQRFYCPPIPGNTTSSRNNILTIRRGTAKNRNCNTAHSEWETVGHFYKMIFYNMGIVEQVFSISLILMPTHTHTHTHTHTSILP